MKPESRPISFTRPMPLREPERLDVRAVHRLDRLGKRRLEPEALVEVHDVVVDGLGDADDALLLAAPPDLQADLVRAAQAAVAADDEEDIHLHLLEKIDHLRHILRPARGAEDRAAEGVDGIHASPA